MSKKFAELLRNFRSALWDAWLPHASEDKLISADGIHATILRYVDDLEADRAALALLRDETRWRKATEEKPEQNPTCLPGFSVDCEIMFCCPERGGSWCVSSGYRTPGGSNGNWYEFVEGKVYLDKDIFWRPFPTPPE